MFAKAREKARQSSCLSNLRQLGQSFVMYRADYITEAAVRASEFILLVDEQETLNDGAFRCGLQANGQQWDKPSLIHTEGTNFSFYDGHAKWMKGPALNIRLDLYCPYKPCAVSECGSENEPLCR